MGESASRRPSKAKALVTGLQGTASVSAAVFFALYGVPRTVAAQQSPLDAQAGDLQEVVVTANRREQSLESVPVTTEARLS